MRAFIFVDFFLSFNLILGESKARRWTIIYSSYVARVTATVRGAARGIFVPSNLSALWTPLQQLVQEMNGASGVAVENSFFQSIFNRLLKEEEMLGSLRAGTHWTPSVCQRILIFLRFLAFNGLSMLSVSHVQLPFIGINFAF